MLFFDASVRTPISREEKQAFRQACKVARRLMAPVMRDLMAAYTKAVRKSMYFPGNYEAPNHKEVVDTAIAKEGIGLWNVR